MHHRLLQGGGAGDDAPSIYLSVTWINGFNIRTCFTACIVEHNSFGYTPNKNIFTFHAFYTTTDH